MILRQVLACTIASLAVWFIVPGVTRAQEATPTASPFAQAGAYATDATGLLGPGWDRLFPRDKPRGLSGLYVGPRGGRVDIRVSNYGELGPASLAAWNAALERFTESKGVPPFLLMELDASSRLDDLIRPEGCIDARRAEGREYSLNPTAFPVGYTLCFSTTGEIVTVIVSGEYQGVTGAPASDRIVELIAAELGQQDVPDALP